MNEEQHKDISSDDMQWGSIVEALRAHNRDLHDYNLAKLGGAYEELVMLKKKMEHASALVEKLLEYIPERMVLMIKHAETK